METTTRFHPRIAFRRRVGFILAVVFFFATFLGIVVLLSLIVDVVRKGAPWLDWDFITGLPSRKPEEAGFLPAIVGSLWMMGLTALFSVPLGVGAAIYLEEYARKNLFTRLVQINIGTLAGVPSVLYGVLGLTLFVRFMGFGRSLLAGSLTMTLLILPIIIISTQEALRSIPYTLREGAYALGATRWQVVAGQLLPAAAPGIFTGIILSLSRALGETAPLIMIGALTFIAFLPQSVFDPFTVMPIQIFNWTARPQEAFRGLAAAGIIVLLVFLLLMNASAIYLRYYFERHRPR